MGRQLYNKKLENETALLKQTSVAFAADDPDTKTLQLSPDAGKEWHLKIIRAWTDEAPPDGGGNVGSLTDIDIFINGTTEQVAKQYASEMIGTTYRSSGVALNCEETFGQRLKITETTNGVYLTATKTGTGTHKLYLEIEGSEL